MRLAPVALFIYSRPDHTARTLDALCANILADQSDLIVFADGARGTDDEAMVTAARRVVHATTGFKSIRIIERERNYGLADNIIKGATQLCYEYGRVIVLEDDLVTSPYFLRYMNEALQLYEDTPEVVSIHGYIYPVRKKLPESFFIRGADCWGWATWQRGWDLFNQDGQTLLDQLETRHLCTEFDFCDSYPYTAMLRDQIAGKNNSWAIRWYASAFLAGGLTLYPGRSLVHNIGNDGSGTHCSATDFFYVDLADKPIFLTRLAIIENNLARKTIIEYFNQPHKIKNNSFLRRFSKHMSPALKQIARSILPPIVLDGVRRLRSGNIDQHEQTTLCFTGDYRTWEEAEQASTGYSAGNILEITRVAMAKIRDGEAVYERDSVIFDKPEYPYPLLAGLLRIVLESGRLSVLDFGGALGSTYFQSRKFLEPVKDLRWSVVEQPSHVACGQAEFANKHLQFFHTVEECLKNETPNTLVLSSVLQYLPKPYETLQQLLDCHIPHVLIDRTAFVVGERDRLTVQTVPETIYSASYPAWFFCEATFSRMLIKAGYRIVDAFAGADHVPLDEGTSYFKGFILELDT